MYETFFRNEKVGIADTSACEKDEEEVQEFCLESVIEESIKCKIPWANTTSQCKTHTYSNFMILISSRTFLFTVRQCSGKFDLYDIASQLPDDNSNRRELNEYFIQTGCKTSCVYDNYKPL